MDLTELDIKMSSYLGVFLFYSSTLLNAELLIRGETFPADNKNNSVYFKYL
jgi:hypothetical protein